MNDAFKRYADTDVLATVDSPDNPGPDPDAIRRAADRIGVSYTPSDRWEDIYFKICLEKVEPNLGVGRPTVFYEYPVQMAALSRVKPGDPRVAERFELYLAGLELANAFSELTDAAVQRRRFEDDDFLTALEFGMPQASGIALGVDRLAMLIAGTDYIEDVLWAPVARN